MPIVKVVEDTADEDNDEVLRRAARLIIEYQSQPQMVVIASTGGAAQHQGGVLGQFEYDQEKGHYIQCCSESEAKNYKPVYLYPDNDDKWWVSHTPGESRGKLYNPTPSKSLPTSGWKYSNNGAFHDDPSLTITRGPLPPLPRQFTVTATGAAAEKWPSYLGVFTRTERWWRGRPVFVNTQGQLLHHGGGDYGWVIGRKLGIRVLRGSQSYHNPASERSWRYWTGSEYKPASVTVTGSD